MPRPKSDTPSYCRHKRNNKGYVTIDGHQKFLPGAYNSAESRAAYDVLIGQWLGNGRQLPAQPIAGITVATVCLALLYALTAALVTPANRLERDAAERASGMVTPAPSDPVAVQLTQRPNRVLLILGNGRKVERRC